MLKNGAFIEGWTDLPPAPGSLINQQPKGWQLSWVEQGQALYDSNDKASGVPECVHKLAQQLPPNEQRGAKDALILVGDTTYKIFHFGAPFAAELKQTVTGLKPGSNARLTVPILAVLYGETDPYGAESGVWVNGEGEWVNGDGMGNRKWFRHVREFTIPQNGAADIVIRFKSKWPRKKDFFIDGVELEAVAQTAGETGPGGDDSPGPDVPTPSRNVVKVTVPQGMRVISAVSNEPGLVVVMVPKGTRVKTQ